MPLLAFLEVMEVTVVGPFTTTKLGTVQVPFGAAGETSHASASAPLKPLMGVIVNV